MLPLASAPAKLRERASWRCAPPRATPNSSRPTRTGSSMTAPQFFWIPPRPMKTFCSSAVEQSSPGISRKQVESQLRQITNTSLFEERKMIRVKNLSVLLALAWSITALAMTARAQDKDAKPADKPADASPAAPPKEESSVTEHSIN